MRLRPPILALASLIVLVSACAGAPPPAPVAPPSPPVTIQPTVMSQHTEGTPKELFARGENALMKQQWKEAADAFETLLAAEPNGPNTPTVLLDLGLAYEGLEQREKARDTYHDLATRFPDSPVARTALT